MTQKLEDIFFLLLRQSIRGESRTLDPENARAMREVDWKKISRLAADSKTVALLYPVVEAYASTGKMPADIIGQWKAVARMQMQRELQKTPLIYALNKRAAAADIPLLFFKGPVLADLYPNYAQRISGDVDVLVSDQDEPGAMRLLEEMGYVLSEASKKHVKVYVREAPIPHVVELHTRLWEDFEGDRIDRIRELDLDERESLLCLSVCGMELHTLGHRQHLLYQIFHIAKHFILEGIGIRYLVDITLYIEQFQSQIDFERFWNEINHIGCGEFCRRLLTICVRYLGMDSRILQGQEPVTPAAIQPLLHDMMNNGVIYQRSKGWQIFGIMSPYLAGNKTISKTRLGRRLGVIFLRPGDLTADYGYAKKCVLLLPVAWVHRICKYMRNWLSNRKGLYNANEKFATAEHRLRLLDEMKLVEGADGKPPDES